MSVGFYTLMFLVLCLGSYFSFSDQIKETGYLYFFLLFSSILYTTLWYQACKQEKEKILYSSLIIDILMIVAYYLLPIIFSVRVTWQFVAASSLTTLGIFWLKHCIGK